MAHGYANSQDAQNWGLSFAFRYALRPVTERFGANCAISFPSKGEAQVALYAPDNTDICTATFLFCSRQVTWEHPDDPSIAFWFQSYIAHAAAFKAGEDIHKHVFLTDDATGEEQFLPNFHLKYPHLSDWVCRQVIPGKLDSEWMPRMMLKDWLGSSYSLFERVEGL